ncbi:retron Ec67 family RNA-directed DNA polymerase/endonuclease [Thioclava sp. GXIMD4215]|uniref:retron Ec67 family RNA-directed DNA polymerase/endonuclease n=1 Tax=Thioclava sp. GXIMD4215 TaxID=3131928 RepID=UPI003243B0C2
MGKIYKYGLKELSACDSLSDIAALLEVKPQFLSKIIYKMDDESKYSKFEIPKKNGGVREICAPTSSLEFMQSRLSRLLYQCYFDIYGAPQTPFRVLSHGFQRDRGLSIFTNAARHTSKRYVLNIDLENFFPSLNFGRVRGFFLKNRNFQLGDKAATAVAQLACFENSLPQGAPSSPIISEFLTQPLDIALQSLARKYRCTYSRYADDITFSTNLRQFPSKLAFQFPVPEIWVASPHLENNISRYGFQINKKKTRMQSGSQWKSVTNLTVNEHVNIKKEYYKGARYCAHAMMTKGEAIAKNKLNLGYDKLSSDQIWGKLRHICHIKGMSEAALPLRQYTKINPAPHYLRLAGDYFHYHRIHLSPKPLIICEGKTDYTYLKEAIHWHTKDKRIAENFINLLIPPTRSGKISKENRWKVDFVKHSATSDHLLDLSGGGGNLVKFCTRHLERVPRFHSLNSPKSRPVLVIVDNDSQSRGMWSFVSKTTNTKTVDGSEPYYQLSEDLYVIPIPKPAGKTGNIYIEHLFPDSWLNYELNGRKLKLDQAKNEKLKSTEYGKGEFSEKVIRANRGKVDCSAFKPLLDTICDIIEGK